MRLKMKFKYILIFFFIFSCTENTRIYKNEKIDFKKAFTSKGFTLVYDDSLYKKNIIKKKINDRSLDIIHSFLKQNTYVKIFNPNNSKFVIAKVKYKSEFPTIYNSVISKRIAKEIDLDINEPYIEIVEIKKNSTFIAKKAKMFEEEKHVANKAPVDDINIISLSENIKVVKKNKYIIRIGDYYFEKSAIAVKDRLINETNISNIKIEKLSENKFRVSSGFFDSFNSMKNTYLKINDIGFELLDVIIVN
jgi:hypothetical protein